MKSKMRVTPAAEARLGVYAEKYKLPGEITIAIRWTAINEARNLYRKSCGVRHMERAVHDHCLRRWYGALEDWSETPYTLAEQLAGRRLTAEELAEVTQ